MRLELTNLDRQKPTIVLDQFPVIVGLDPGADLCLDDSSVGHYQCMIDFSDGVLMVWDLGTKAGTTINGVRIVKKSPLLSGDEIGIGRNRFVARYDDGAQKTPATVAVSAEASAAIATKAATARRHRVLAKA